MSDHRGSRPARAPLVVLVAGSALALAGCPQSIPPRPMDDAGTDANVIVFTDSDGDGLCDATELAWGTDPNDADTDGDGVSDRVEVDFGFQPTRTDSPDRELLVYVGEEPGSSVDVPIDLTVRAAGQSYTGAFQSLAVFDPDELDAAAFYAGSVAVGADPMSNVFQVVPDEERIEGVDGRTRLVYQVSFEAPMIEARGCMRAYPWRYNVKRNDGTLVFARRYVLVAVPDGEAPTWCAPAGCI